MRLLAPGEWIRALCLFTTEITTDYFDIITTYTYHCNLLFIFYFLIWKLIPLFSVNWLFQKFQSPRVLHFRIEWITFTVKIIKKKDWLWFSFFLNLSSIFFYKRNKVWKCLACSLLCVFTVCFSDVVKFNNTSCSGREAVSVRGLITQASLHCLQHRDTLSYYSQ